MRYKWFAGLVLGLGVSFAEASWDAGQLLSQAQSVLDGGDTAKALELNLRAWHVSYPTQQLQNSLMSVFQKTLKEQMEKSDYDGVLKTLRLADRYFPNQYVFSRFLLYVNFNRGDFNQTLFHGQRILEQVGEEPEPQDEIRFYMGHSWHKLKAYKQAIEELEKIRPGFEDRRSVLVLLGDSWYHGGDLKKGLELLKEAQQIQETDDVAALIAKISRETPLDEGFVDSAPTPHYVIRTASGKLQERVEVLKPMLEAIYMDLAMTLQFYPEFPIRVIVYEGDKTLAARLANPSWAAGVYDGEIRIPAKEMQKDPYKLETLLRHETMHLFLDNLTRNRIPTWLNEGIAQYYELPFSFEEDGFVKREDAPLPKGFQEAVTQSLRSKKTLDYKALSSPFMRMEAQRAQLAYAQSLLMVKYLLEKWDGFTLRRMLQEVYQGGRFDAAFQIATGLSPEEFLESWKVHQKDAWKLP